MKITPSLFKTPASKLMLKLKRHSRNLLFLGRDSIIKLFLSRKYVFLRYYDATKNVGDELAPYIAEKITGKTAYHIKSKKIKHMLSVGSIIHMASPMSAVWGSGVIDPNILPKAKTLKNIDVFALRGEHSKAVLNRAGLEITECPLGDPAVLMPLFFNPKKGKKFNIGIVPHYVDKENSLVRKLSQEKGVSLIDVSLNPEEFISKINECHVIASSSLHGLILSDSYEIPNTWIKLSNKIIGHDFKFFDYYTTTDNKNPKPLDLNKIDTIETATQGILKNAKTNKYLFDKKDLLSSFPTKP